jgi:Na+/citrate or Na+/malate symporter
MEKAKKQMLNEIFAKVTMTFGELTYVGLVLGAVISTIEEKIPIVVGGAVLVLIFVTASVVLTLLQKNKQ